MEKYIINITDDALADLEDIYNYIAYELLEPENAKTLYERITDAILTLNSLPERYRIFDCEPEHSLKIRRMIVDNYLVCYVVTKKEVTILSVLYGASDIHAHLAKKCKTKIVTN